MRSPAQKADKLLILSPHAGTMTEDIEAKLRTAFEDHLTIDFDPRQDFEKLITPDARVIVAGGDGTIEAIVRRLADSDHPLGILPMGSFNNLAHALGLTGDLDQAIEAARIGLPRAITLGRVNGHVFVEACAVGVFGDAIVLGESAKDLAFGAVVAKLGDVLQASRFHYSLTGDLRGEGEAMSLVFSNTASIGIQLPVSSATPVDPYLEFSADAGRTRTDIVARFVASTLLDKHAEEEMGRVLRFRKLRVKTRPRVRVYADNQLVARTPATIAAEVSALKVLLPVSGNHK
ncbi:MAG TPA: diacylglycerol kinase family protein [Candidatus Dormibacteraeota bacterium]|nr:diacylglycerol kinase family protein [Candidatus Dormibacteraeota bacterium]